MVRNNEGSQRWQLSPLAVLPGLEPVHQSCLRSGGPGSSMATCLQLNSAGKAPGLRMSRRALLLVPGSLASAWPEVFAVVCILRCRNISTGAVAVLGHVLPL